MRRHLGESEFVDLIDGVLPDARRRHLDTCQRCREQARTLREVLARTADADVPPPSPLFWDQFSARVRGAVADTEPGYERTEPRRWVDWMAPRAVAWGAAAVVVVFVTATVILRNGPGQPLEPARTVTVPVEQAAHVDFTDLSPGAGDLDADEAWGLVRAVADDLAWDDAPAAGLSAGPGSAERVALELSNEERSALAQLIAAEIKRAGA